MKGGSLGTVKGRDKGVSPLCDVSDASPHRCPLHLDLLLHAIIATGATIVFLCGSKGPRYKLYSLTAFTSLYLTHFQCPRLFRSMHFKHFRSSSCETHILRVTNSVGKDFPRFPVHDFISLPPKHMLCIYHAYHLSNLLGPIPRL